MKYDKLTIMGLPKKFKVYYALDYLYSGCQLPDNPDDIIPMMNGRQMATRVRMR